ncbi:MAG: hypothetical protein HQM08_17865 [Candidatus Riflebacteria bacterium]|nr:hypothetical protein [Candidatus Riflebacteria bacterium]
MKRSLRKLRVFFVRKVFRFRKTVLFDLLIFFGLFFIFLPQIVMAGAWVLSGTRWTNEDEKNFSDFVRRFGESGHGNLNKFIRDPNSNPFYSEEDKKFNLLADCADLPYVIRAYVAYKLKLPFSYISSISGGGGDERYSRGNHPTGYKDQDNFQTPQGVFGNVQLVNSGYYRMAPDVENSDTYPVRIDQGSIIPGTIYYDPNGHVAIVYQVSEDGRIRLIDAHPDKSVSRPWFGSKFARGNESNGGGFRKWRPQIYSESGKVERLSNHNLTDFSPSDQYQNEYLIGNIGPLSYFDFVRMKISQKGGDIHPLEEFKQMIQELYEDLKYRAEAVEICVQKGVPEMEHPGFLPFNIYGTEGLWEEFSTPSRDARLKVGFQEFYNKTIEMIGMAERKESRLQYSGSSQELAQEFLTIYNELSPKLKISYLNSSKKEVFLSFDDIEKRLFLMSFDPFHSVELRWGASGHELLTAHDTSQKRKMYEKEKKLRNQLERLYNQETNFNLGPDSAPEIDIKKWLENYLNGQRMLMASNVVLPSQIKKESFPTIPVLAPKAISPSSSLYPAELPPQQNESPRSVALPKPLNVPTPALPVTSPIPQTQEPSAIPTQNEVIQQPKIEKASLEQPVKAKPAIHVKKAKPGEVFKIVSEKSFSALKGIFAEIKSLVKPDFSLSSNKADSQVNQLRLTQNQN